MPPTSQLTRTGPPKLSEQAKHLVAPRDIASTGWPAVRKTCVEKLGITFDPWQDGAGRLILAKRSDGNLAAMVDGVGISLPRQVGKTYLIGATVFALCVNMPGLLVIWSAHHARTHGETFLAMQGFAERNKIQSHVKQVFTGSGDEEIRFHNGSRILFGARERGFGRGIPGVDVLIFDEAQILSDRALSNMLATLNTSRFGLQLYIGTPPKPEDMSESFKRMRREALAGTLVDGAWIEFGADANADGDDRKQWRKANPSYPIRTPAQSLQRLKRKLTEADWLREGMGIWDPDYAESSVITEAVWASRVDKNPPQRGDVAYGIKFSPDGTTVAISAAQLLDGIAHVELIDVREMREGSAWIVDWLVERESKSDAFVIDGKSHRDALVNALAARKFKSKKLILPTTDQVIAAHSMMLEAVTSGTMTHFGDATLAESVKHAGKRVIGTVNAGGWGWKALKGGEVTSLESATLAHFGALIGTTKKQRSGNAVFR